MLNNPQATHHFMSTRLPDTSAPHFPETEPDDGWVFLPNKKIYSKDTHSLGQLNSNAVALGWKYQKEYVNF